MDLDKRIQTESHLEGWHQHLLGHLILEAGKAVFHMDNASKSHEQPSMYLGYSAWALRTLYEARIWFKFCLVPKNAEAFVADRHTDIADIAEAMLGSRHWANATGDELRRMLTVRRDAGKGQARHKIEKTRLRLRIEKVDALMNRTVDYRYAYRMLSKLAHVTPASVTQGLDEDGYLVINGVWLTFGMEFLDDMIQDAQSLIPKG